jgi:hypothetical protein
LAAAAGGALLGEAVRAEDGASGRGYKGNLRIFTAGRALHVGHLAITTGFAALASATFTPRVATIGAARGFVVVAAFAEELLLTFAECEGGAAVAAYEGFVWHFLLQNGLN